MIEIGKEFMGKPLLSVAMIIVGIVFVALGILILFEPQVFIWFQASASFLIGIMLLIAAGLIYRIGSRFNSNEPEA